MMGDALCWEAMKNSQRDRHFRDHIPFFEYFHGDNGRGVGASHQTGWTGLIANLLCRDGVSHR